MSNKDFIHTNWICPYCGAKMSYKVFGVLELRVVCDKCGRMYVGKVNLLSPINKVRHRFPKYIVNGADNYV